MSNHLKYQPKKMAEKLGISRQTYIDIENGVRIPKADTIYKISVITNQSINYFFYDNTEIGDIDQISILLEQLPESKKKWFFAVLKKIIECEDLL
ncbi:helix-turn-helix transcriptional regulator [Photobacterium kishitanii]|uniref:helix-turn-helix transcriptional regulator n=1 Tax=Photobacterium kishitanii TaxID=318456 RepID=UPI00273A4549|nr:helix-turn-helix transcriptional regulator [Photobacterium kishitanii]